MTVHPYTWRSYAEANYRHEQARKTGAHRGYALEELSREQRAGPRALVFGFLSGVVVFAFMAVVIVGVIVVGGAP